MSQRPGWLDKLRNGSDKAANDVKLGCTACPRRAVITKVRSEQPPDVQSGTQGVNYHSKQWTTGQGF